MSLLNDRLAALRSYRDYYYSIKQPLMAQDCEAEISQWVRTNSEHWAYINKHVKSDWDKIPPGVNPF